MVDLFLFIISFAPFIIAISMGFHGLHRCHDLSLILRSALKILSETSFSYSFCSFYWAYCFSNLSGVDDMGVLRSTTTFTLVFRHPRRSLKWRSLKLPMASMLLILRSTALPRLVLPTPTSWTRIFCLSFPVFLRFFKSFFFRGG